MKITFLKISVFILLFAFIDAGCKKDEEDLSYLDYTKFLQFKPGFAIYKTKKDYFFNVNLWTSSTGEVEGSQEFIDNDPRVTLYKGKYYYNSRYRLDDNYILSFEVTPYDCFTSISYDEYIRNKMSDIFNDGLISPKLTQSIIDRDPFTEFYYLNPDSADNNVSTIELINQLIKEKNLEKYFTKIK